MTTTPADESVGDPPRDPVDDRTADTDPRVTALLAASLVSVYLLVVVGATTSLLEGATACATWPTCDGRWVVPLSLADPGLVAAWLHRVATVATGGLLAVTAALAVRSDARRRVRLALGAVVVVLYPAQVGLGALVAASGAPVSLATAHLVVGVTIFSGALLALAWHFEGPAAATSESPPDVPSPMPTPSSTPAESTRSDGREPAAPASSDSRTAPASSGSRTAPASSEGLTVRERVGAYVRLTKPKLWWLLCLVAVATMVLAADGLPDPGLALATVAGGILAIGASGTFNNVFERDVDRRMDRTDDRPLVTGQIPVWRAAAFGLALAAASAVVFATFVNVLAAGLGLLAVLFYSVAYTLVLKPNTSQNIVLGGAVGAFPALIGWAAVEDAVGLPAVVLGAVIFLWTPAHFYNLALAYREDYERAGIPMLPVVRGAATTRRHILWYLGATMLAVVGLGAVTDLGWVFAATVTVVGGVFLWAVVRLSRERTEAAAFRAFHASNAYLGALLVAVVADTLLT